MKPNLLLTRVENNQRADRSNKATEQIVPADPSISLHFIQGR